MFRNSRLEKLMAKSTSELLMDPDWETNLAICDLVRGQEATPKEAINCLKKRFNPENPHVLMLSLSVLEALMKNCGKPIHDEVLGTDFVMNLLEYTHANEEIRSRIFGYIQNWEFAFKNNEDYHYLHEAYDEIKLSGYPLPPFHESEAMFSSEVAPNWKDGEECFRCKSTFTTFRRKHHCRNCGNVFCGECTTGRTGIPRYGIEKEVRVCDVCLHELARPTSSGNSHPSHKKEIKKFNGSSSLSQQQQLLQQQRQQKFQQHQREQAAKAAKEKALRLQEEEELQLALALSASEAESKQKQKQQQSQPQTLLASQQPSLPTPSPSIMPPAASIPPPSEAPSDLATEVDPELAHYLNRNYWAGRAAATDSDSFVTGFSPSAPAFPPPVNPDYVPSVADTTTKSSSSAATKTSENERPQELQKALASVEVPPEGGNLPGVPPLTTAKQEEFLAALRKSLDVFSNRMRICSQRGRQVATDSTLQTLFKTLHQMNLQLLQYSNDLETRRTCLEKLQDQTAQIREAREALDDLRRDYAEQRRREEEEAHRQRQILMMQKVEVLRQQKREPLLGPPQTGLPSRNQLSNNDINNALQHAIEAQNRQLMEQSMALQQQYGQYGYGQPQVYAGVPPMMPYGAPPMGYPPSSDYFAQQHQPPIPYDPSLHQQPPQQPQSSGEVEQPTPTIAAANAVSIAANDETGEEQAVGVHKPAEPFDMQSMIQAMPPSVNPQIEYAQPSGPQVPPALIEKLPVPPSDELAPRSLPVEESNSQMKPPTPQLICLE